MLLFYGTHSDPQILLPLHIPISFLDPLFHFIPFFVLCLSFSSLAKSLIAWETDEDEARGGARERASEFADAFSFPVSVAKKTSTILSAGENFGKLFFSHRESLGEKARSSEFPKRTLTPIIRDSCATPPDTLT